MKSKLNQVFGVDPRSLALFRVCTASLLLADLAIRLQDFSSMYTEEGILPLAQAGQYHEEWRWSLHFFSASSGFQGMLFALAVLGALALLAGWHTRPATVLSWVLLVSLHVRMPLVLNAGDSYLRLLLFWSMFLPLGKAWSLDDLRRPQSRASADESALSVASAAILLQVCIVYWYSGLAKLNEAWLGGSAMDHLLRYSMLVKPFGEYLLGYQDFLGWLTRGTVLLEIAGPFALLVPWRPLRAAAILLFAAFHLGIELTLHVGLFAAVSLTGLTLFLPPSFWTSRLCTVVRGRVKPLRALLAKRWERPLPPDPTQERLHRLTGGRLATWGRRAGNTFCLLFLVYVVASWDFSTLRYRQMPEWLKAIGNATMLPQAWGMFHTAIPRDYWYVYRGILRDGRAVDILEKGVLTSFQPAAKRADAFPNHRWRRLHVRLVEVGRTPFRQPLAEHLFRRWNEGSGPGRRIEVLEMYSLTREVGRDAGSGKHGVAPFARVTAADLEDRP